MRNDFVITILCHCRPYDTTTVKSLRDCGYTGDIILVLDDEDETLPLYQENFPECTIEIFSKDEMLQKMDIMNSNVTKNCGVYARNACFEIAKSHGYKYFMEADDDYIPFTYRYIENDKLYRQNTTDLDSIIEAYLEFLEISPNIEAVAFAEPGDFVGGVGSNLNKKKYLRKCMGSWMMRTDSEIQFMGLMNDDVLTYSVYGMRGKIFITFPFMMIDTVPTQSVKGGMTELYNSAGTYMKTFYSMLATPSFVKVGIYGDRHYRIHHNFTWNNACPKIISGRYRK